MTKYNPDIHDIITFALAKKGFQAVDIADAMGITPEDYLFIMRENESLKTAYESGANLANLAVEACLFIRCQGYEYDEKEMKKEKDAEGNIRQTEIIRRKKLPPDVKACITWLEVHQPNKWKQPKENTAPKLPAPATIQCKTCNRIFDSISEYINNHSACKNPIAIEILPAEK